MKKTVAQLQTLALPKQSNVKRVVYWGLLLLALTVALYVYFIGKIVFDVVAERSAETGIHAEQGVVSTLETSYFKQLQSLNADGIASIGLSQSTDTLYATRLASVPTTVGMANEF